MTSIPAEDHPTLEPEFPRGPGAQLRRAREALNWGVADVASKLRLDAKLISALEGDDFAKLP